ncbi:DALR anticodon-binding domain-containing protein, partial [Klebsiella pneumoniae]|uniref:DALR anticodon-binding domain-containing protein n=1 Tax=Klebsiella pneumoniae TaxID=573 RepID=UPI00272FDCAA
IALFPDVVESSSQSCNPAALAEYAHTLAADFNLFYRDCQVLGSDREEQRLALVRATQITLRNALGLLGIAALEEM